jgi:hypothetical protein
MKKIILFSLCSISFFGVVKSEEVAAPKSTVYGDVKKMRELGMRLVDSPEKAQEHVKTVNKMIKISLDLAAEESICAQAGNCETSEELGRLFREFSKVQLSIQQSAEEVFDKPEYKELKEIFSKYND